jgi:quinol---cytochrome c reductase cytochrome c subunit, bacillus type
MTEIPESLLRRSAEAKAKALGIPVEQVLAEMKGEAPPTPPPSAKEELEPAAAEETIEEALEDLEDEPEPVEETPTDEAPIGDVEVEVTAEPEVSPAPPTEAPELTEPVPEPVPAAVATAVEDRPSPSGNGSGNGKVASVVSPRPVVPPKGTPEGVRTQRLLTVVKARAIQNVKAEPADKVNTWPHLMLMEFGALLAITGLLVIMAVVIHSPLLDPANFNATPNPSKAPWYFLGLQELLSYFDPQIAGVMVPTITGMIGFMMIPFVDKNPSTRPSDRKFAIALYSVFLAGAATLTMFGVLFRGRGFNFSYPWKDGVFFDDLKDWVNFE